MNVTVTERTLYMWFLLAKVELLFSVQDKLNLSMHTHTHTHTLTQKRTQMNQSGICKGYRTDIWWVSEGRNDLSASTEI